MTERSDIALLMITAFFPADSDNQIRFGKFIRIQIKYRIIAKSTKHRKLHLHADGKSTKQNSIQYRHTKTDRQNSDDDAVTESKPEHHAF